MGQKSSKFYSNQLGQKPCHHSKSSSNDEAKHDFYTFEETLKMVPGSPYGPVSPTLLHLFRALFLEVYGLHMKGLSHGNLNSQTILVSPRYISYSKFVVKLSGPRCNNRKCEDMYALGEVLLLWYSGFSFNGMSDNISKSISECPPIARDIIKKLLEPNSNLRPTIHQVYYHPSFWSADKLLGFLTDVSDALENNNYAFLVAPIDAIRSKVFPTTLLKSNLIDCRVCFSRDLLLKMQADNEMNVNAQTYRYDKVQSLLRILRYIIINNTTLTSEERGDPGRSEIELEYMLREKFPNLLINVYTAVEGALQQNPELCPSLLKYYSMRYY